MSDDLGIDIVLRAKSSAFELDAKKSIDRVRAIVEGRPLNLFGGEDAAAKQSKRAEVVARAVNAAVESVLKAGLRSQDAVLANTLKAREKAYSAHARSVIKIQHDLTEAYIRESQRIQQVEANTGGRLRLRDVAASERAAAERRRTDSIRAAAGDEVARRQLAREDLDRKLAPRRANNAYQQKLDLIDENDRRVAARAHVETVTNLRNEREELERVRKVRASAIAEMQRQAAAQEHLNRVMAPVREDQRNRAQGNRIGNVLRFNEIRRSERDAAEDRRTAAVKAHQQEEMARKQAADEHLRRSLNRPELPPFYERMRGANKAGKFSGRGTQMAFQLQQTVEDYSYAGFRGASNNLAFLASMVTGSKAAAVALGGLAAITLATAVPAILRWVGGIDQVNESIDGMIDRTTRARDAMLELASARFDRSKQGSQTFYDNVETDEQRKARNQAADEFRNFVATPRGNTQIGAGFRGRFTKDAKFRKLAADTAFPIDNAESAKLQAQVDDAAAAVSRKLLEDEAGQFSTLRKQIGKLSLNDSSMASFLSPTGDVSRSKLIDYAGRPDLYGSHSERILREKIRGNASHSGIAPKEMRALEDAVRAQRNYGASQRERMGDAGSIYKELAGRAAGGDRRSLELMRESNLGAFDKLDSRGERLNADSLANRQRTSFDRIDATRERIRPEEAINKAAERRIDLLREELRLENDKRTDTEDYLQIEETILGKAQEINDARREELTRIQSIRDFASDITQTSRELLSLEKQKSNEYEQQVRAKQELIERTEEEKVKSRQSFVSTGFGLLRDKGRQFMEQAGTPEWMIQRREMGLYNMQAGLLSRNAATAGKTGNFEEQIDSLKELQRLQLEVVGKTGSPWMANASFSAAIQTQQQIEAAYEAQKASANQAIGQLGALQVQANITADSVKRIADYKFDFGIDGEIAKLIGFRDVLAATRAMLGADAHLTEIPAIPAGVPGAAPGMRGGGLMPGYGGGDRRQIVVEDGEYVVRKEAVKAHGVETLNRLNNRFANGGLVAARELRGQPGWRRPGEAGVRSGSDGLMSPFAQRRYGDYSVSQVIRNDLARDLLISSGWIGSSGMVGAIHGAYHRLYNSPSLDPVTQRLPSARGSYAGGSSLANGADSTGHDSRSMAEVRASARRSAIAQGVKFPESARYYRNGKLMNPHDFAMGSESTLNRSGRSLRSEIEAQQAQRAVASVREAEGQRKSAEAAQIAQNRRHNIGPSPLVAGDRMARARTAADAREADMAGGAARSRTELADLQFGREHGGNALAARQKQRFNDLLFNIGQPQSQLGAAAGPATHSPSGDPLVQMGAMGSSRSSVSTLSGLGQYASYARGAGNAVGAATRGIGQLQTALAGRRAEYAAEMANRRAMHASQMADRRKSGIAGRGGSLSRYLASRSGGGWGDWGMGGGFGGGGGVPMAGGLPGFGSSGFSGPGTRTFGLWDGLQRFARGGLVAGRDYEGNGAYDIGGGVTREGGGGFDYLGGGFRIGGVGMEDQWEKQRQSVLSGRWSGGMDAGAMGRGEYGYFSDGSRKSRFSGGFSTILKDGAGVDFGGGRSGDYGYFSDGSARSRFSGGFAAGGLVGAYSQQQAQAMAAMMRNSGTSSRSAPGASSTTNNSSMHFGNFNVNVKNAGDLADLMSQQKRIEHAARLRRG